LPAVKSLLENIAEDQKRLTVLEERKTEAMENIAAYLKKLSGHEEQPAAPDIDVEPGEIKEEAIRTIAEDETVERDPDEILRIIKELREGQGLSFEKIANHLNENGISTLSGRGKWRGQAVSKLYK
jgi:hypothetical protein